MKPFFIFFLFIAVPISSQAQERLRLATTTSTDNSGLLAVLHPPFEKAFNVEVDVIAVGTGKALKLGENGDVDVLMVHAPAEEMRFIKEGYGVARLAVMHNDFVLLGPPNNPANVMKTEPVSKALTAIANKKAAFISRGDDSGTHKREKSLWRDAGIRPRGAWYLSVGQGMGAAIKIADDKQAYTLSDRGTYLAYKDKIELLVLNEGGVDLFNPYHIMIVNPDKHPHVKTELAEKYVAFIRGERGQRIIRDYQRSGEPLFIPDVIP